MQTLVVLRRLLTRRWYRLLIAIAAAFFIGVAVTSVFLYGLAHTDQPLLFGALSGLASAFSLGIVQALVSIVGAMKCPMTIRAAIAVVVPVFAVASLKHLPVNLEFQSVPMILMYCVCFASLITGTIFRYWVRAELVGQGGRLLTRSPQWCDYVLAVSMGVFFWSQYRTLGGGWYGSMTSPGILMWSLILSATSSWGFVSLSRFRQRRKAYSLAIPISVVAMFMLYLQFRRESNSMMPWHGFLSFALMAPIGWCVAQECVASVLSACGWKWRPMRRRRTTALRSARMRIHQSERGWRSMACIFLVVVATTIGLIVANLGYLSQQSWTSSLAFALFLGAGWAGFATFTVLAAHHSRNLLLQSVLVVAFWYAVSAINSPKVDYAGFFSKSTLFANAVVPTIVMAIVAHTLVRIHDRTNSWTIGTIELRRRPVGINDLLMLTLLLGCGFALIRFTEPGMVVFSSCHFALNVAVTFVIFRAYFVGPSIALVVGAVALIIVFGICGYWYWGVIGRAFTIAVFVFVATDIALVRWLHRVGWRKLALA